MSTTLILVSHGETVWDAEHRFVGRANVPLSEVGLVQAEALARYIQAHWEPEAVYCSPLQRARQMAEMIAASFRLHERSHPGFLDIDFGAWQGLSEVEVARRWAEALHLWRTTPHRAPIPGGEMLETVRLRGRGALREVLQRHQGGIVVIVTHTTVARLLLLEALGLGNDRFLHIGQDRGAMNLLTFDGEAFTLWRMNCLCPMDVEQYAVAAGQDDRWRVSGG